MAEERIANGLVVPKIELPNLLIDPNLSREVRSYQGVGFGSKPIYPERERAEHADALMGQLRIALPLLDDEEEDRNAVHGVYLEVTSKKGFSLKTESLDDVHAGMRVVNVEERDGRIKATVYARDGGRKLAKKITEYRDKDTQYDKPKNADLVNGIDLIAQGTIKGLWAGKDDAMPAGSHAALCELWLEVPLPTKTLQFPLQKVLDDFSAVCDRLQINADTCAHVEFPGLTVLIVKVTIQQLTDIVEALKSCPGHVVEIRDASTPNTFILNEFDNNEQHQLGEDLAARTSIRSRDAAVCLLDTGVNREHILLSNALDDSSMFTYNPAWGTADTGHNGAAYHGSLMAGTAEYGDVKSCLEGTGVVELHHVLESVKMLPPNGDHQPEHYPFVTSQCVSKVEGGHPFRSRAICMAITADSGKLDGTPTAWSSMVDQLASGSENPEDDTAKRLFIVSAGNIGEVEYNDNSHNTRYPTLNVNSPIQDPAQAWNALAVGAYSKEARMVGDPKAGVAVAPAGDLSPYSRTSLKWDTKWPIKPDVVCDGGNLAMYYDQYAAAGSISYTAHPDLDILTTSATPLGSQFTTFRATSAATAQASWLAAELMGQYPQFWPETIRGLIVHSARWERAMLQQFIGGDRAKRKGDYASLLRTCGYGVPSLTRAIQCANNSVNLIIQDEIVPFMKGSSDPKLNEIRFYELPWPHEVLRELGETDATIRVTLSYFVEPGPEAAWGDRYKYPSHGLRFEVIRRDESKEEFRRAMSLDADGKRERKRSGSSIDWTLGPDNRDIGSLHSDLAEMSAVDLCEMNYIAVYPVKGWWATRKKLERFNSKARFSLIVSVTTPKVETDLYSAVKSAIANKSASASKNASMATIEVKRKSR